MSMIQMFHVGKRYDATFPVLNDITLTIERGEFVFLTGPSGAGKTTLLKMLLREEIASEGQIIVNGRNIGILPESRIPQLRRSIGVVFQDFKLIQRKTVFENVTFIQRILGIPMREQKRRAYQVLKMVGLHHKMHAFPQKLSGGEQQRVAIARAIINDPDLLLADEPTGNLDPDLASEIMELFREINFRGTTVVVATHDRELIRRMGKRVIGLERGHAGVVEHAVEAVPFAVGEGAAGSR